MAEWGHNELLLDLAQSQSGNGIALESNLSIGPYSTAGGRMDLHGIRLSWTRTEAIGWEVKVSRSDFFSDVNAGKYRQYLPFCHRLYFAVPAGMISKVEIPPEVGLVVRGAEKWSGVKAAPRHVVTDEDWATLFLSHIMSAHPGPWKRSPRVTKLRQAIASEIRGLSLITHSKVHKELLEELKRTQERRSELDRIRSDLLTQIYGWEALYDRTDEEKEADAHQPLNKLLAEALKVVGEEGSRSQRESIRRVGQRAGVSLDNIIRDATRLKELLDGSED